MWSLLIRAVGRLPALVRGSAPASSSSVSSVSGASGVSGDGRLRRALAEADVAAGGPAAHIDLRWLLADEASTVAYLAKKVAGTGHPILDVIRSLVDDDKKATHLWGSIVLLVAKAGEPMRPPALAADAVAEKQRSLAEIVETIHVSHLLHRSVIGVPPESPDAEPSGSPVGDCVAILCGDYLLANSCKALAALENNAVVDLMADAIGRLSETRFFEQSDGQDKLTVSADEWTCRNSHAATLVANGCRATSTLASLGTDAEEVAQRFGTHVALAWQARSERDSNSSTDRVDGTTTDTLQDLCRTHVMLAAAALEEFPRSDAKDALGKILQAL